MNTLRSIAPNQKYGLIKKAAPAAGSSTSATQKRPTIAAFRELEDSDSEEEGSAANKGKGSFSDVNRVNRELVQRNNVTKEVETVYKAALAEDESVFDYDGVYDTMKAATVTSHPLSRGSTSNDQKEAPKARYITNLKAAAAMREMENDRVYERKLLKERDADGVVATEDEPKFVTSAYKEKLLERQKWEYEEKMQAEMDKRHDVKKMGMQGFYSNLLTKNIAVGGDVTSSALSAFTAGSARQDNIIGAIPAAPVVTGADADYVAAVPINQVGSSAKGSNSLDNVHHRDIYDNSDEDSTEGSNSSSNHNTRPDESAMPHKRPRELNEPLESAKEEAPPVAKSTVNVIQSAKERYLARKMAKSDS